MTWRLPPASGNDFLNALNEGRPAYPDARESTNITCVGILTHESAMDGGKVIFLPEVTLKK
jgi:hypothetical protein